MSGHKREKSNGEALLRFGKLLADETDNKHSMTTGQIVRAMQEEGYSVSRRTIMRYISYFNQNTLGDPVAIEVGKDGKELNFKVMKRLFEPSELKAVCRALEDAEDIPEYRKKALIRKLKKLTSRWTREDI